jgi:eukaryotic-like serine/threonine-protein kinase
VQGFLRVDSECDQRCLEAQSRTGTTLLDKWHLDALIGIGGMAAVFEATHRNGMRGAVKVLSAPYSRDADVRARFLREGYIANRVGHPDAVQVLDDDTTSDGRAFLVMELLEGHPLHALAEAEGGRLDAARVLFIADRILDVLIAAHDKGIVHRDIKPDNVFLTLEGRIKVLDFGIARIREGKAPGPRATQSGAPMGTPAFMAPEQARGRWDLVGPQSDVWSVGATMFTLLAGEVVHDEETVAETLSAAFTKPARSIATVLPHLPKAIGDLVDRALALDPAARWPGAGAMQAAVRDAYRQTFGEALPPLAPRRRTLLVQSRPSLTPLITTMARLETRPPRRTALVALAWVAVLTLAGGELFGSSTESAGARPRLAAAPRAPSASTDDGVDAMSHAPFSPGDDATARSPVVTAPPSAQPSRLAFPAPSHRAAPNLHALFDRRN